jgi:hypothetical protein
VQVLLQKEELEQQHLHLLQIVESEKTAKNLYTQQVEELSSEIRKLRAEVNLRYTQLKTRKSDCVIRLFIPEENLCKLCDPNHRASLPNPTMYRTSGQSSTYAIRVLWADGSLHATRKLRVEINLIQIALNARSKLQRHVK